MILSIAGATLAVAQVNPDDFTEEPDKTMAASHFVKGETAKASQQIRKAATYVRNESNEVAVSAKADVEQAAASLDKLGRKVKNGTVNSEGELRKGPDQAQASLRALQKTGQAIKEGAKQLEDWFNDIGNGIKEVGRKLSLLPKHDLAACPHRRRRHRSVPAITS